MGLDYRGIDRHSGLRVVSSAYQFSIGTMNHGAPPDFPGAPTPGGIVKQLALPAPVAGTPRVLTRDRGVLLVPMPMVLGLACNTTAGTRSISVRFTGYDLTDNFRQETLTITAAPASANALVMAVTQALGAVIFSRITAVELLSATGCAGAVTGPPAELGDTIKVGTSYYYNPKFGFPAPVNRVEDVLSATLQSDQVFAAVASRGINLLEGNGIGNQQFGRIDLAGQYLELVNTTSPAIDFLASVYGAAAAGTVTLNMRVRTSVGFSSGAPAYSTADIFIPSAGE